MKTTIVTSVLFFITSIAYSQDDTIQKVKQQIINKKWYNEEDTLAVWYFTEDSLFQIYDSKLMSNGMTYEITRTPICDNYSSDSSLIYLKTEDAPRQDCLGYEIYGLHETYLSLIYLARGNRIVLRLND